MGASCVRPKGNVTQEDSLLLTTLNDDLLTLILSFCATAPLQDTMQQSLQVDLTRFHRISDWIRNPLSFVYQPGTSTLTHQLPLVCRRLRDICYNSDLLWNDSLAKTMLIEKWDIGSLLKEWNCADLVSQAPDVATTEVGDVTQKLEIICRELSSPARNVKRPDSSMSIARFLYIKLWRRATQTLPALFMRTRLLDLGETINLHLFEPRYQLMIAELVEGRLSEELDGSSDLKWPYPKFLFVPIQRRESPTAAFVTVVKHCRINQGGSADISIMPIQIKNIVSRRIRPNSRGIHYVTV